MDAVENVLHGIVGALSAWIPGGGAGAGDSSMSREFWMPDQSCRVCYECESHFTIFNRRHHCRVCGRVFCGRCTLNTISASSINLAPPEAPEEDCERIRVCNFCYRLRQQQLGKGDSSSLEPAVTSPSLTPTSSRSSLISSNTSGSTSMASPRAALASSERRGDESDDLKQEEYGKHLSLFASPVSFFLRFANVGNLHRSDDEDEGRKGRQQNHISRGNQDGGLDTHLKSQASYYSQSSESFDDKGDTSESRPPSERSFRRSCDDIESLDDENNFRNHLYEAACREVDKSVDFENNKHVWYPPPPEEDEDETGPGYEDEDDDDEGGWGLPRSSGSMSSTEYRSRERAASEEHRKAMRAVVDGHFRALVAQLLRGENISVDDEDEKDSWLDIVTGLALQAASIVKPDSSRGGSMDPGGYVKVKCIASGRRSDSMIIKGIVCKKNLAHKRMITRFKNPRLLIIGGALEYQRVSNQFSSMDTLLQQERDYLNMAAARIEAQHPNVVLVEKGVTRFAQDRLLAKEISLVQNVKRPLLERIARCTGAQIISTPDNLAAPKAGHCELFHIEKFVEELGSAGQAGKQLSKTLMFFEGCPKPLGCTALLRGANGDDLKKIKRVLQLSVFASYHLALETSFLADEGASLPDHRSPIVVTLPSKQSSSDRSITSIPGFSVATAEGQRVPPVSPSTLTSKGAETNNTLMHSAGLNGFTRDWQSSLSDFTGESLSGLSVSLRRAFGEEAMRTNAEQWNVSADRSPKENAESFFLQEGDREGSDADEQSGKDDFPPTPSDHQSILVSLSTRCLTKGSVCERPNIVRIKYYGNSDKPLGRFLRDTLFDGNNRCQHCDEPADAHIRCYTHRLGSLTISVRRMDDHTLPGERDGKIWMWHRCLKCPRTDDLPPVTRRIVMSDAAWGLSFGKFLELSFSNHAAASRVAVCGHQLHRDCLRFYGFGNMIACFRYASVHLHSIHLPPPKLEFNDPSQQEWLRDEANEIANKGELVFTEILDHLRVIGEHIASSGSFSGSGRNAEARKRAVYLEAFFQKEKAEFEKTLLKAVPSHTDPGQPVADILELCRLRKDLALRAMEWDKRLHYFAASQQRKYTSAGSDPGMLPDQPVPSKDASVKPILKTYSNTNVQPFASLVHDEEADKPTSVKDDTVVVHDMVCNMDMVDGIPCLPVAPAEPEGTEGVTEALGLDVDLRRTLSEGSCPVVADISHTLDAAWSGETQAATEVPCNAEDHESAKASEAEVTGENGSKKEHSPTSSTSQPDEELTASRQKEFDELGNWIDGPYSTLYRGRGASSQSPSTSFISQQALQGGARLFWPPGVNGTVNAVYEDEPTSIIAHALLSQYYVTELGGEKGKGQSGEKENGSAVVSEEASSQVLEEGVMKERSNSFKDASSNGKVEDPLLSTKGVNLKIENSETGPDAKLKYIVTAYYAKHFDALRKKCCAGDLEFVRSLSRCRKWGAQGGKSNVFFAKSMDDRFIVKQVTRTELLSFLEFAPEYFKYLFDSINSGSPTCLAKILGMYQVIIKQVKGGKEVRMDLMVMENLLYGRHVTRLYDLKGSVRSRYNSDSTAKNAVLLDQNLLESMPTAPIFVGNKAKRLLERAVWNDTSFLANIDVMDYSLLVGIDEERGELVLGIIDFMRQYTWDKHLETWVKASGILGGPKNAPPTVISPKQYKKRFRKAMSTYFVTVPDHWTPPSVISACPGPEESGSSSHNNGSSTTNGQDEYGESFGG
ncbi:hypothetical protein SELMODRAFT_144057 [Selaginella moellendorffii]|uniref:1-phosphatidylinositol-3-phosphate 5-kinase n=1 Tax=Selaginella moellendorffii TaxID=88036 RepID=D8R6R4_SELML|nr:hypothetical protein SELMODRAFT_144057 [Selaginella moellendorffii]